MNTEELLICTVLFPPKYDPHNNFYGYQTQDLQIRTLSEPRPEGFPFNSWAIIIDNVETANLIPSPQDNLTVSLSNFHLSPNPKDRAFNLDIYY